MRAPLLSFVLVLAVITSVHLIPVVCISRYEKLESKGEEEGSVKPLSVDGYGPLEKKATGMTKDHVLNPQATPAMTGNTYDQKPSTEHADMASASTPDEKEAPAEVKKEKSDESDESAVPKKVKKEKKKKSDESDENSEPSYGSSSIENFGPEYGSTSPKKQKKETSDYSDESASPKKEKKKKKAKSDASDQDASLIKKEKKKEKKSGDSDKATSHKKQKKEKKGKKSDMENPEEDAAPVDVSTDGAYVPSSPSTTSENSDQDASTPVDVSTTTTAQYLNALKNDGKPKATPAAADANASPDQPLPAAKSSASPDAYASPDELPPGAKSASSIQTMAAGSPDELPPSVKSSASPDAYASPDELPPGAKSASATPDPYEAMKFAAGADGQPLQPAPGMPKLSMDMIKKPIVKILSPVIKGVCAQTQYPADCEASIGGLPGAASAAATDSAAVLKLAMAAVREKVIQAANTATARMNAPGTDKQMKEALSSCASSYNDVKASLDTADDALKNGDIDTASTNLDTVETDVTDCDQYFSDFGDPSIMRDHDKELSRLTSNLVAIGAALRH